MIYFLKKLFHIFNTEKLLIFTKQQNLNA